MAKDPGQPAVLPVDRDQLLREKETELARILDEHDDLVSFLWGKRGAGEDLSDREGSMYR